MARQSFSDNFAKCEQYMRHKTTIINPYLIKKRFPNIKICKTAQKANEFIVNYKYFNDKSF